MSTRTSFYSQIVSCTFSEAEYDLHADSLIAQITQRARSKISEFLETIYEILTVPEYSPIQKFYALSLLVRATKTKNTTLMDQIASSKSFLNKLFKDAQFDKYKESEDRGRTFFSQSPTEEEGTFGNSYIRLLLGAFSYWDKEFGTEDEKDPYHCYYAIQSALTNNLNKSFTSSASRKRSQSPEEFKLKAKKVSSGENTETEAHQHLMMCVPSIEHYDTNSPVIFERVEKQSSHYNRMLLNAINAVLTEAHYASKERFYALYLLVQLTETNNKAFVTQLANESKLLNKIYAMGKKAFTKGSPRERNQRSDDTYQQNLDILVLEAVKYWHFTYGSSEPSSPYYHFTYLHLSLKDKGNFPKDYKYIKAIPDETVIPKGDRDHLFGSAVDRRQPEFVEESGDPIARLIRAYNTSGIAFKEDHANISCILIKQPAARSEKYLEETLKIIKSAKTTPRELFYTVYLLAKTTESKNSKLITALVQCRELVEVLYKDAQFDSNAPPELRGRKFFSNDPNLRESTVGCNYVQLVLEAFSFWGKAYGSNEPRNERHVLKTLKDNLERTTRFVDKEYYIGRNLEEIDDEVMEGFEGIPFYDLPREINRKKAQLSQVANSLVRERNMESNEREEGRDQDFALKDLDKKLEMLNLSKIVLAQFLATNRKAEVDEDLVEELVNKVIHNYKENVFPYLEYLIKSREPERERYTRKVYEEGKISEKLEKEHLSFSLGKIDYLEFRKRIIATLTAQSSSVNDSDDLLEKVHQSLTKSEVKETREPRMSSRSARKSSNSRGTRRSELEIIEDDNENGSEDERANSRTRGKGYRSTWSSNRDQSQRGDSRSRERSHESKRSVTFTPSRSKTPVRDSAVSRSPLEDSILSGRESNGALQELKKKLEQMREDNQQLNRQNRVLQNEKLEALQAQLNRGDNDAGQIQDLKALVEESRRKMEQIEKEVEMLNEKKRKEQERREAEAKKAAEEEEKRKVAEKEREEAKLPKDGQVTGKDLQRFLAQKQDDAVVAPPVSKVKGLQGVSLRQEKGKEVGYAETKTGNNVVVDPKGDRQQVKSVVQTSVLDSFLMGNNKAY